MPRLLDVACVTILILSFSITRSLAANHTTEPTKCLKQAQSELTGALAQQPFDGDFSFIAQRPDGQRYVYNRGASTPSTLYESASTSKMVTAAIILRLVGQGKLSLSSHPQDLIPEWPISSSDSLYKITLATLLSFTSGLIDEPICTNSPTANFKNCVLTIAQMNAKNGKKPGKQFYYNSNHLQVAGLMAINASGASSWQELFNAFHDETGLFSKNAYDLPSLSNPRLAGGMHWTGNQYMAFLSALKNGTVVKPGILNKMLADHTPTGVVEIVESPAESHLPDEDWHYGFGLWLECESALFDCNSSAPRVSSAGAYGAYPWIDLNRNYFGILATQGQLGTGFKGVLLERSVRPQIEKWLACPAMGTLPPVPTP